jgi:hypothetical protein
LALEPGQGFFADLAQLVEQLFRKQQVWGSSPQVGSTGRLVSGSKPKWRNRQTRYVQGVVPVRAWEFKSPLRHQIPTIVPLYSIGMALLRPHIDNRSVEKGRMIAGASQRKVRAAQSEGARRKPGRRFGVDSPDWHASA